jgi:integrase
MAAVRFFCLFVLEKEWVLMFTPRLKETTTPPSILTSGEMSAIIAHAGSLKEKLILMLLYSTGIRSCELVQIKIEDINSNEMLIKINGKNKKIRYVPLIPDVLNELRSHWIAQVKPSGRVFYFVLTKILLNLSGLVMFTKYLLAH